MTETVDVSMAAALMQVVVSHDGDEYVVGRPDLGIYLVVPEPGAVLIEALQAGEPLAAAIARASEAAGAEVDGEDFLAELAAAGLWDAPTEVDGPAAGSGSGRRIRQIRWIEGVSPAVARRMFGPVAWSGYGLAAGFAVAVLVARPDLRPSYEHILWLPDPVLSLLALFPIGLLLAAGHEAWHWLAGRAIGVPAIFRVSYRGIFLVFETDLTQIVATPRRRRYGPFLAGMCFNASALAVALGLRLGHRTDMFVLPAWFDRLLAAIVLAQVLVIVWQWAALFMRSDGYAVLANALRCHDLYRATWLTTKARLWGVTDAEAAEFAAIGEHDRRVARWFGLLFLAGLAALVWMLFTFALPFSISIILWVGHNLANPSLVSVAFWESAVVVAITMGQYAVIPLLAWRERRLRQAGALR